MRRRPPFAWIARSAYRRQRDELRALLAPLLAEPWTEVDRGTLVGCLFCAAEADTAAALVHDPTCPVRRRGALLGEP